MGLSSPRRHEKGLDVTHRLRETPTGTTRRCRLTPVRMAVLKSTGDSRRWRGCAKRGPLGHCRWEGDLEPPLWRAVRRPLRTAKIELPRYQAIPPLGGCPQERKRESGRQTCTPSFAAYSQQRGRRDNQCPPTVSGQEGGLCASPEGYHSAIKRKETLPSAVTRTSRALRSVK